MMNNLSAPLTVVGAGPAGIMAAHTAAEAGVDVLLIDDNPQPGGQYYHQSPAEFRFANPLDASSGHADAASVLNRLPHPNIRHLPNALVWGVFDSRRLAVVLDGRQSQLISTDRIILATGAYDRPFAFPGWTLPGILGAGAVLRMLKSQWVLPGRRILLAGLSPLQLALGAALAKAGAEVVCVAEAADPLASWQQLPKMWGHWDRLQEAVDYFLTLGRHKIPLLFNHAIVGASGKERVERAQIARLDGRGAPIPGTEKQFEVDTVCLGYGLLPSFQLAAALGCQLRFDEALGWWAPEHDEKMETSQPGLFVAGDVTGIGGVQVARVEGQIAGLHAAHQLGALQDPELTKRLPPLRARLRKLNRAADAMQKIYAFRPGLARVAKDDTLLCRCEEITFGQAKQALANGAVDVHQMKLATRTGMGYCQGRFCSVLAAPLVAEATGRPLSDLIPFTVRPPIQPIPLEVLGSGVEVNK